MLHIMFILPKIESNISFNHYITYNLSLISELVKIRVYNEMNYLLTGKLINKMSVFVIILQDFNISR